MILKFMQIASAVAAVRGLCAVYDVWLKVRVNRPFTYLYIEFRARARRLIEINVEVVERRRLILFSCIHQLVGIPCFFFLSSSRDIFVDRVV